MLGDVTLGVRFLVVFASIQQIIGQEDDSVHTCDGDLLNRPPGSSLDIVQRDGRDIAVITCNYNREMRWELACLGQEWIGQIGVCPTEILCEDQGTDCVLTLITGLCPIDGERCPKTCNRCPEPGFFVSNETHILNIQDTITTVVAGQVTSNIVGVAADIQDGLLFWSDNSFQHRGIYKSNFDGTNMILLTSDISEVNGLAVDWVNKLIYWTDAQRQTIEVCDYHNTGRIVLINTGLSEPRAIVAEPVDGYLYWNDQGSRRIERSNLDGSEREVIVADASYWPNQMAWHYETKSLLWVDAWNGTVSSWDSSSQEYSVLTELSRIIGTHPVYGMMIHDSYVYTSIWGMGELVKMTVHVDEDDGMQLVNGDVYMSGISDDLMFSLASRDEQGQPTGYSICIEESPCSDICLSLRQTYRCACSTFGGRVLAEDAHSCIVPDNIILYVDGGTGDIAFLDANITTRTQDLHLIAHSRRPVGVAFDPVNQRVYWSDVLDKAIYSIFLNGTNQQILLNHTHGLGTVDGLLVDPVQRQLYFTNMDFVLISGVAYTWHKIEMVSLDGGPRFTVTASVEQPRGLALDAERGFLYYTDWGSSGAVIRTALDGSNPVEIIRDMDNPNAVLISKSGDIYVLDSHDKSVDRNGVLYKISNDESGNVAKVEIEDLKLEVPFGLTSSASNALIISDWNLGQILSFNPTTQETNILANGLMEPLGLIYTPTTMVLDVVDPGGVCGDDVCADLCIQGAEQQPSCRCPNLWTDISDENSKCKDLSPFLLVCDMSVIRLYNTISADDISLLSDVTEGIQTDNSIPVKDSFSITEGSRFLSTFTAMVYDQVADIIYFTDTTSHLVYMIHLSEAGYDNHMVVIYKSDSVIDGLVHDSSNHHLYWSEYDNNVIVRWDLNANNNEDSYRVIVEDMPNVKWMAIDPERQMLYWVSGNSTASSIYVSTYDGEILDFTQFDGLVTALHYDNSAEYLLAVDEQNAFYNCNADSLVCDKMLTLEEAVGPITGLQTHDQYIYYTDWGLHGVFRVNYLNKHTFVVAKDLIRPTSIMLMTQDDIQGNCAHSLCGAGTCIPLPGSYLCECVDGINSTEDRLACIHRVFQRTSFFSCPESMTFLSSASKRAVYWPDPVVITNDPDGVDVNTNHVPGSEFLLGFSKVRYTATSRNTNEKEILAQCQFNITIVDQGFPCDDTPSPLHGEMSCFQHNYLSTCHVVCNNGYQSQQDYANNYTCRTSGWSPEYPRQYEVNACLAEITQQHIIPVTITTSDECDDSIEATHAIAMSIIDLLTNYGLCGISSAYTYGICDPPSYSIRCSGGRTKRQVSQQQTIVIESRREPSNIESGPGSNAHHIATLDSAQIIIESFGNNANVGNNVDIGVSDEYVGCLRGYMLNAQSMCVQCGAGTFYSHDSLTCELCVAGSYQPLSGQVQCLSCPQSKTTHPGAFSRSQCMDDLSPGPGKSTEDDGSSNWSTPLIIVLCCIAGIVLLIAIVFACISLRRMMKKKYTVERNSVSNSTLKQNIYKNGYGEENGYQNGTIPHAYLNGMLQPDESPQQIAANNQLAEQETIDSPFYPVYHINSQPNQNTQNTPRQNGTYQQNPAHISKLTNGHTPRTTPRNVTQQHQRRHSGHVTSSQPIIAQPEAHMHRRHSTHITNAELVLMPPPGQQTHNTESTLVRPRSVPHNMNMNLTTVPIPTTQQEYHQSQPGNGVILTQHPDDRTTLAWDNNGALVYAVETTEIPLPPQEPPPLEPVSRPVSYITVKQPEVLGYAGGLDALPTTNLDVSPDIPVRYTDDLDDRHISYVDVSPHDQSSDQPWQHSSSAQYYRTPPVYTAGTTVHVPGHHHPTMSTFQAPEPAMPTHSTDAHMINSRTLPISQKPQPVQWQQAEEHRPSVNGQVPIQSNIRPHITSTSIDPEPTPEQQHRYLPSGRLVRMVPIVQKPQASPYATLSRQHRGLHTITADSYEPQKYATVSHRAHYRASPDVRSAFPAPMNPPLTTALPHTSAAQPVARPIQARQQDLHIHHLYNHEDDMASPMSQGNQRPPQGRRRTPGWKSLTAIDMTTQ